MTTKILKQPVPAIVGVEGLRELSEKATPGPWKLLFYNMNDRRAIVNESTGWIFAVQKMHDDSKPVEDAEFTVACVNYVRSQLAAAAPQGGEGKKG